MGQVLDVLCDIGGSINNLCDQVERVEEQMENGLNGLQATLGAMSPKIVQNVNSVAVILLD